MKKIFRMILLAALLAVGIAASPAGIQKVQAETTEDGIYYWDEGRNGINIIGCVDGITNLVIPETIAGKAVTSIGIKAFENHNELRSVSIPAGVKSIGDLAFSDCSSLASIEIPAGVVSIGQNSFYGCESLTSIKIPASVTSIRFNSFHYCSGLESIVVDEGNTTYDSREGCNGIIETSSNTLIAGCKNTKIPSDVASIGAAFWGCSSLTSIEIPESVTSIGDAFTGCSSLTNIEIPESVTSIWSGAFRMCSSLASMTVAPGNKNYDSRENCNGIIETESNSLIAGCKNTTIPASVRSIEDSAFSGCSSLTSIEIPEGVTHIGQHAFAGCSNLISIKIPEGVTGIWGYAFVDCSRLRSIEIPASVMYISWAVFGWCNDLKDVYYTGSEEQWEKISIDSGNDPLTSANIHYNSTLPDNPVPPVPAPDTGSNNQTPLDPTLGTGGDNQTPSGQQPDAGGNSQTPLVQQPDVSQPNAPAPGDVKAAGAASYTIGAVPGTVSLSAGDKNASKVEVGAVSIEGKSYTVTAVSDNAFKGAKMTSLTIGDGVETIGKNAFSDCQKMKSVTIGKDVKSIAAGAFAKCRNLKTVKFTGSTVPSIAKNAFKGSNVKKVIVPKQLRKNKAFLKKIKAAGIKVKKLS